MEPNDARRLSPRAQEDHRRRVVRALVDRGMTQVEAVDAFGVGRTSVHHWAKAYRQRGAKALASEPRGRPATPPEMIDNLRRYLWSAQRQPHILADYFLHQDIAHAAVGRCSMLLAPGSK